MEACGRKTTGDSTKELDGVECRKEGTLGEENFDESVFYTLAAKGVNKSGRLEDESDIFRKARKIVGQWPVS